MEKVQRARKMDRLKEARARANEQWQAMEKDERIRVLVGTPTCGRAAGAQETLAALQEQQERHKLGLNLIEVGCMGFCYTEPLVAVIKPGQAGILYGRVDPQAVAQLTERWLLGGDPCPELALGTLGAEPLDGVRPFSQHPMMASQVRIILRRCGFIDPTSMDHYLANGGYLGFERALTMTPDQVIEEIKAAGLRGRGGAGFPTWLKWRLCRDAPGAQKYIICNADEGDPGAFMNRALLESDPHSMLEGMLIGGYAMGATRGYIYVRAEYPLAVKRLRGALQQMHDYGLLGEDILGSGFNFDIIIREGAGAFVCGEETALIASVEGRRGMPRPRPPFPATSGLWGKPTNINNVETWASSSHILREGAAWYAQYGTEKSKGTKTFALAGKVKRTGLIEVPLGITLREIIYEVGGGIPGDKKFKAVQTGGPSGGCIAASLMDTKVDYESLAAVGSIMGSGGMIVMDEDTCAVNLAHYFLSFTRSESCGKCPPCRIGTQRMLELVGKISSGRASAEDLAHLEAMAAEVKISSLCGLGQTAPNPVLTTLKHFRDEYEVHIREHRCPASACFELVRAKCTSACPAGVDVPSYIALVAQGRYAEGLEIHRRRNPFALVCGRICPAFCEVKCRRGELDEAIAIRQVKRFMADHELERPWTPRRQEELKAEKVAVIGSGPAGLTAALRLAQKGYPVTVFEALPVAGGMMAVGIPDYRLPREILNAEIENIKRAGVEIRLNTALGRDFSLDDLLERDGYKAVILAIGAHKERRLGIEGEDMAGVYSGTGFLRDIALGRPPDLRGKKVAVVGGGNVAIDAARSAWRLGASEVYLVYRRTRAEMPAYAEEVEGAEKEGVQFHFLVNPSRVLDSAGKMTGVELVRQELGEFDSSGRRRPMPIAGSEFTLDADVLVAAISQEPDLSCIEGDSSIEAGRGATFVVNTGLATTRTGVFAAGDAVLGPSTVIESVAQGNRVADTVDNYLRTGRTEFVAPRSDYAVIEQPFDMKQYANARRPQTRELAVEERRGNFGEVELLFDEKTIQEECKRCLRCDLEWLQEMSEGE
jgi:NADH-quinone oxidoreductase subunit F